MATYSWPCVSDLASPAVGEICRAWICGVRASFMDPWRLLSFRPQEEMQESIILHVVAFRFWVRPCPFWGGGMVRRVGGVDHVSVRGMTEFSVT